MGRKRQLTHTGTGEKLAKVRHAAYKASAPARSLQGVRVPPSIKHQPLAHTKRISDALQRQRH